VIQKIRDHLSERRETYLMKKEWYDAIVDAASVVASALRPSPYLFPLGKWAEAIWMSWQSIFTWMLSVCIILCWLNLHIWQVIVCFLEITEKHVTDLLSALSTLAQRMNNHDDAALNTPIYSSLFLTCKCAQHLVSHLLITWSQSKSDMSFPRSKNNGIAIHG